MNDWRLTNQKLYLDGVKLVKSNILSYPDKDHEHCCFCWGKFGKYDDMLKIGYCTADARFWVCETCYNDFKILFNWIAE